MLRPKTQMRKLLTITSGTALLILMPGRARWMQCRGTWPGQVERLLLLSGAQIIYRESLIAGVAPRRQLAIALQDFEPGIGVTKAFR